MRRRSSAPAAPGCRRRSFQRRFGGAGGRDQAMADWLAARGVELVVLAGYMQLLSASFWPGSRTRVINVHPALLPAFPGIEAVEQALAYGVRVFGVTVHFVDGGVDTRTGDPAARGRGAGCSRAATSARAPAPDRARAAARSGAPDRPGGGSFDPANPRRRRDRASRVGGVVAHGNRAGGPLQRRPPPARCRSPGRSSRYLTRPVSSSSPAAWPSSGSRSSRPAAPPASSPRPGTGSRDLRPDGLPGDHGRPRQDAPPQALRGAAGAPRRRRTCRGRRGARGRADRPRLREPLSVRAHRRDARCRAMPR